ncbi:MAG: ABC transporter permease, partial [Ktedonobacteraceae bacterium]
FTDEQIQQRINEVLEDVELTARRKLLIKKLSGGQRKRVSIALELLANPSVFFLDEPTSGLDPGLDRKMMFLLRKLADKGHTIVLVTHATNNINSCDYVCFLCQGGRLAYFGPPEEAKAYFGKTDFAEIYSSLEPTEENRNIPEEAEARFKVSKQYQEYVIDPLKSDTGETAGIDGRPKVQELKRPKRGNPFKQFSLLFRRQIELFKNNTSNLVLLFLQAPLIGLILVLIVRAEVGAGIFDSNKVVLCAPQIFQTTVTTNPQTPAGSSQPLGINTNGNNASVDCNRIVSFLKTDTNGKAYVTKKTNGNVNKALQDFILPGGGSLAQIALFIVAFIAVMFGTVNGIREIVKENAIYRRERTVNLGIMPYLLSKVLVLGVISLIQSAELLLIIEIFEPLRQGIFLPVLLESYIAVALAGLAGMMIGLTASAFAANEDSATSLIPFLLIPQIIFAGSQIPLKDYVLQTLSVLFPARWAIVSLGSSVGIHSDKLGGDSLFGSDPSYHGTLFSTFSQTDATHRVLLAWGALGAIILVLSVVTAIGLKRKDIRS